MNKVLRVMTRLGTAFSMVVALVAAPAKAITITTFGEDNVGQNEVPPPNPFPGQNLNNDLPSDLKCDLGRPVRDQYGVSGSGQDVLGRRRCIQFRILVRQSR